MPEPTLQTAPTSYTWGFAGAPIQIHLSIDVVSRLREQILDSDNSAGILSACGLLTGDMHKPGITTILDFKPLETLNADSVTAAIDDASAEIVGFYRTIPVGLESMPQGDKALAETLFRNPNTVFMLVEARESTIGDGRFCFWGEGQIFDFPLMEFPLDAAELAAREAKRHLSRAAAPSRRSSASHGEDMFPEGSELPSAVIPVSPPPAVKRRQAFASGWLAPALVTVVLASLLVSAFLYSRRGSKPPVATQAATPPVEVPSPLGLSVETRGNDLRVSWDGNAAQIAKADFGMLLIRGGAVSRDVPLTAEELRAGSVVYASAVDQLRFQLTVVSGGQVAREFLTIVMPQEVERPASRANLPTSPAGNSAADEAPRPAVSNRVAPSREFRQLKETRDPATVTHPSLDEPPQISSAAPVNSVTPALLNHPAVSPNPPPSGPAPVDAPAQGTRPGLAASEAQPPVATHQVVPPVPALLRGIIWKATAVDVNVAVDASGKVVKAEAAAKPGLHPLLRDAAVQAALRWKFQPAQFDGHAVPANIVLQFNFSPNR